METDLPSTTTKPHKEVPHPVLPAVGIATWKTEDRNKYLKEPDMEQSY